MTEKEEWNALFETPTEAEMQIGYKTMPRTVEEWVRWCRFRSWEIKQLSRLLKSVVEKLPDK